MVPDTLTSDAGIVAVSRCLDLLHGYEITDVDVEICESVVANSASPVLLEPYLDSDDPTVNVCNPLIATLDFPICAETTPSAQGSSRL